MHRLFVAIPIPAEISSELCSMRTNARGIRWMSADQMHITLHFLGEVDSTTYQAVKDVLLGVMFAPFSLEIASVGYFGSKKSPRHLWAGVTLQPQLVELYQAIGQVLTSLQVELEKRKFKPHITLARLKGVNYSDVGLFLQQYSLYKSPLLEVTEFHLYSSKLSSDGPTYQVEATYPVK